MPFRLRVLPLGFAFVLGFGLPVGSAQTSAKPDLAKTPEKKPDYSQEAFVDEESVTRIVFENDGTGVREAGNRVRIQSDAGVQRFGVLTFPYQSAIESLEVDYVRTRKPDGTVVSTPADTTQDMPTEITRQAPFYSDLREKQVAVKGLSVGDVLEYHAHWRTTKPLAPGQFWYAYNFTHDSILLQEQLQISVPRDRAVKWKSPSITPVITEENARRIFTWSNSQLEHKSSEEEKKDQEKQGYETARGKLPPPDVQISTFQSWDEVGAWYNSLQLERVKPSDEIRAKAAELTKAAADDNAKIRAIYNYVSTQFRYIGVAFGIGRYQPHSAAEVLSNQYGDCKDKHTLLASLLDAAGIQAHPALINTFHELDSDVPSPAQFDHVITAVPQGKGYLWLDTTSEVAPFGYLIPTIRDKRALVIPNSSSSVLIPTPADMPFKASLVFKVKGKLDDDGTLEATMDRSDRGDAELLLRLAFRSIPQTQWKELVQNISNGSGFGGVVSDVGASQPASTSDAFHFSYAYNRKEYSDWKDRQITPPFPPLLLPVRQDEDKKPSQPLWLGATGEWILQADVELPKDYAPTLPMPVNIKRDFAEYHATYEWKKGVLHAERRLFTNVHEIPPSQYDAYKSFSKLVIDDENSYIALSSGAQARQTGIMASLRNEIWELPDSNNADAMQAETTSKEAMQRADIQAAISDLKRAVVLDPLFVRDWLLLGSVEGGAKSRGQALDAFGSVEAAAKNTDEALDAFRKGVAADPKQPLSHKLLARGLMASKNYFEAVSVWQDYVKLAPEDADGLGNLASALVGVKRYEEAASALESLLKLTPDNAQTYESLGTAYLNAKMKDKAMASYAKALELAPQPWTYNDVGYELADANEELPLALQYVEKAVHEEEEASAKAKLADLKIEDLAHNGSLAAFWDSLGWVHFRLGHFEQAERYLEAAWNLSPGRYETDHLDEIHKQQHKSSARPDNNLLRTTKLPLLMSGTASAEFFIVLTRDPTTSHVKVEDVKFISGSEKMRPMTRALSSAPFDFPFPDTGPTHLVRRGILGCYEYTGCSFVLYNIGDVHSVN